MKKAQTLFEAQLFIIDGLKKDGELSKETENLIRDVTTQAYTLGFEDMKQRAMNVVRGLKSYVKARRIADSIESLFFYLTLLFGYMFGFRVFLMCGAVTLITYGVIEPIVRKRRKEFVNRDERL